MATRDAKHSQASRLQNAQRSQHAQKKSVRQQNEVMYGSY